MVVVTETGDNSSCSSDLRNGRCCLSVDNYRLLLERSDSTSDLPLTSGCLVNNVTRCLFLQRTQLGEPLPHKISHEAVRRRNAQHFW